MITRTGVRQVLSNYWAAGIVNGLLALDGLVLAVCFVDGLRFQRMGFSFWSAFRIGLESATDGNSAGLALGVFLFFVIALPTLTALLLLLFPLDNRPKWLQTKGPRVLATHLVLSSVIAVLTTSGVAMEVLAGWTKAQTIRYRFFSYWIAAVLMAKPVYVFYVSPIVRKLIIRLGKKPKEIIEEVLTEDRIGGEH